jgi:hypothetical protein
MTTPARFREDRSTIDGGRPLASLYDRILNFDYENLNTTIEDNGRALKARLEAIGLREGHGKALDIVAHSTGGSVARWFFEREGGNRIARRLIMLGTPNWGWPWPRIADWATLVLGLALNQLTAIPWPASILGDLVAMIEDPIVDLKEANTGSSFLSELNQSLDPGIPYVILAGNASIVSAATASTGGEETSLLARLVARLTSPDFLHTIANPLFLGQPSDLAVSVASMEGIAASRKPAYDVRPVACDHLSYFRDPAGLKALAAILAEAL